MIIVKCTEADRKALAGISIDPQEMMDDGTDYSGLRINKPWGHEIEKYRDASMTITWLHIHTNKQTSLHCHQTKTVMICIISGRCNLVTLDKTHFLSEGSAAVMEPGAFHRITSRNGPICLYEIESPPNKHDLIRLEDSYGRIGRGYERIDTNKYLSEKEKKGYGT